MFDVRFWSDAHVLDNKTFQSRLESLEHVFKMSSLQTYNVLMQLWAQFEHQTKTSLFWDYHHVLNANQNGIKASLCKGFARSSARFKN